MMKTDVRGPHSGIYLVFSSFRLTLTHSDLDWLSPAASVILL